MGWEVKRLEEVFDIARGGSPRPIKSYITDAEDGINWIKISDATASSKYITETKQKIKPEGKSRSRYVKKGDFLLSNSMSFGRPYIMGTDGCIHDGWLVLSPKEVDHVDQNFLYYLLGSPLVFRQFDSRAAGSTVRNLNIGLASSVEIPVPPFEEQKKIVAILDQAFAEIDKARANAERNLKNARELFDNYLNQVFSQRGEGWEEKKLGDVCTLQRGFDLPKRLRTKGKYPLLSSSGVLDTHKEAKVVGPGVVTGRSGSIGGVFFIAEDFWPLNTTLYIKNFHDNDERYIYWLLKTFKLERFAGGAGVPTLNRNVVHEETVIIATDIKTQKEIASKLDNLNHYIDALINKIESKLESLEELKKSILQKAFSGELT